MTFISGSIFEYAARKHCTRSQMILCLRIGANVFFVEICTYMLAVLVSCKFNKMRLRYSYVYIAYKNVAVCMKCLKRRRKKEKNARANTPCVSVTRTVVLERQH